MPKDGIRYFVFEGCDNVGKTTLIKEVAKRLPKGSFQVIKEPGGRAALLAEGFSEEWLAPPHNSLRELAIDSTGLAQRALFLADSLAQEEVVDWTKIILSDRSWVSDLAYGNLPLAKLYLFNMALRPERPMHVFYLSGAHNFTVVNKMDERDQKELHERYLKALTYVGEEVTYIKTDAPPAVLAEKVIGIIRNSNVL